MEQIRDVFGAVESRLDPWHVYSVDLVTAQGQIPLTSPITSPIFGIPVSLRDAVQQINDYVNSEANGMLVISYLPFEELSAFLSIVIISFGLSYLWKKIKLEYGSTI
jgi:hypothetical protein